MPRRRLKTMEDIRRYMADLINRTEHGKVEAGLAGKLGYLSSILVKIIETGDIEKRLEVLERKVNR